MRINVYQADQPSRAAQAGSEVELWKTKLVVSNQVAMYEFRLEVDDQKSPPEHQSHPNLVRARCLPVGRGRGILDVSHRPLSGLHTVETTESNVDSDFDSDQSQITVVQHIAKPRVVSPGASLVLVEPQNELLVDLIQFPEDDACAHSFTPSPSAIATVDQMLGELDLVSSVPISPNVGEALSIVSNDVEVGEVQWHEALDEVTLCLVQ